MKIGKQPKRFGGPSKAFIAKRDGDRVATKAAADVAVPDDGGVRIYLDDERPVPDGWTLAKSPAALMELLGGSRDVTDRVTHLSLDWYLGTGITNGEEIARRLAARFRDDPDYMPRLEAIGLHSSDRDKAIAMMQTLRDAIPEDRWFDMRVNLRTPRI